MLSGKLYACFFQDAMAKKVDWVNDNVRGMIVDASYVPDKVTHKFKSDITGELVGIGYTAGGADLLNRTISYDAINSKNVLDSDDFEILNVTLVSARYVVFYINTNVPATSQLVGYVDLGSDQNVTAGTFKLQFSANGLFTNPVA